MARVPGIGTDEHPRTIRAVGPRPNGTPTATSDARAVFTVEEAGRFLGISRGLAYEAVRRGEIPSVRLGRRILVPAAALRALLGEGE